MLYYSAMRLLYRDVLGLASIAFLIDFVYCVGAIFSYSWDEACPGCLLLICIGGLGFLGSYIVERLSERFGENEGKQKGLFSFGFIFTFFLFAFYPGFILAVYIYNGSLDVFWTSLGISLFTYLCGAGLMSLGAILRYVFAFVWPNTSRDGDSYSFLALSLSFTQAFLFLMLALYAFGEWFWGRIHGSSAQIYPFYPSIFYWVLCGIALINALIFHKGKTGEIISFLIGVIGFLYFPFCILPLCYFQPYYYFQGMKGLLFVSSSVASFMLSSVLMASCWPRKAKA